MNNYDKEWWVNLIGLIPEDFFVKVEDKKVCLYYKGEGYENLVSPAKVGQLIKRDARLVLFVSVKPPFPETCLLIHSTILKVKKEIWEKRLGQLPDGFYIKVSKAPQAWKGFYEKVHCNERSSFQLSLHYNGPGYKELTESGGKKPPENKDYAFLCMHAVPYKKEEVISYILERVKRAQEELSG